MADLNKKMKNNFSVKRKSGEGVCGSLKKEGNHLYSRESLKRIALLGKTGSGKSSLANTIFGDELFTTNHSSSCVMSRCQAETRSVHGRNITLIDTPGLFDTEISEEELKSEIVRCITECSPGPHAFLIVLKVERFTEQEDAVITKILQYFSEDALKYAVIVFTHGDQLHEEMKIKEFVSENKKLSDLGKKCGGRCHVIDNKYWKKNEEDDYRNNRVQVEKLLDTIDKMVMENNGGFYTNEMLQEAERKIQNEVEHIQQTSGDQTPEQNRTQAKATVHNKFLIRLSGVGTGVLLGALLGLPLMVGVVITAGNNTAVFITCLKAGAAAGAAVGLSPAAGAAIGGSVVMAVGGVAGGVIGYKASKGAKTPGEAAKKAADEVFNKVKSIFKSSSSISPGMGQHNAKK